LNALVLTADIVARCVEIFCPFVCFRATDELLWVYVRWQNIWSWISSSAL